MLRSFHKFTRELQGRPFDETLRRFDRRHWVALVAVRIVVMTFDTPISASSANCVAIPLLKVADGYRQLSGKKQIPSHIVYTRTICSELSLYT